LKEGRKHGEVSWDGRDGAWRVRNEAHVLERLLAAGVSVPKVYSGFELDDNFYLVMEFVDGESLHDLLLRQTRRLPIKRVLSIGVQIAAFLEQLHRAGWAWRDCKPKNLIVSRNGNLVPIDFEGASPIKNPDPVRWGTRAFIPVESGREPAPPAVNDDLFALGSTLYLLITGRIFNHEQPIPIDKLRRKAPAELRRLVELLLGNESRKRPTARSAHVQLNSILRKDSEPLSRLALSKAA